MKNITDLFLSELKDFRIFPAVGNHDTFPANDFRFLNPWENPTFNEWAPSWTTFIEDEE